MPGGHKAALYGIISMPGCHKAALYEIISMPGGHKAALYGIISMPGGHKAVLYGNQMVHWLSGASSATFFAISSHNEWPEESKHRRRGCDLSSAMLDLQYAAMVTSPPCG